MSDLPWTPITESLPVDAEVVETKNASDAITLLVLLRTLWWTADHSVMAPTPTHWRPHVPDVDLGDFKSVMPFLVVPENGVVVVAGAFKGAYLKYLSQRFPTANLHGFEPQKEAYEEALKNLAGCKVTLYNQGLATATRDVWCGKHGSDGCSVASSEGELQRLEMVDAVQAFNSIGGAIDLLVLNAEGSEWPLLPYLMDEMMHHRIKTMAVQFHPDYVSSACVNRVVAALDEYYNRVHWDWPHWTYLVRSI